MHTNITETMFIEQFRMMGREDQFSLDALKALYEYYEDLAENTGGSIELDVIAICCGWSEDYLGEIVENYGLEDIVEDCEDLNNETFAIALDNGKILYQNF